MPAVSKDVDGATAIHQDEYGYDQVGNVIGIIDAATGQAQRGNRDMVYDGLDRLTDTTSPMYGTSGAHYTYDVLDNVTRIIAPGRDQAYCYDQYWRLTNVKVNGDCSTGATILGTGFDVQGNLANWNGVVYAFDYGNRLRSIAGSESYRYDAWGRRTRSSRGAGLVYSLYNQGGQLLFQRDERSGKRRQYVYLNGSLVAEHAQPLVGSTVTVTYQHTDALGSPVATTNSAKVVLQRSEYEPYGKLLNRPMEDGPGYTGHVSDAATSLIYMQQRYYDPRVARFWSVDPVTVDSAGGNFNRYWYANNNPYRFTDLDGRQSLPVWPVPGYYKLNEADKPREGRGEFASPRNTAKGPSTHSGIDIQAPVGTPVVAAGDGVVVNQQPNPSKTYGNQIVIDHGKGLFTQSAHLDSTTVKPGDAVTAGQGIGTVGTTGNTPKSGDSHLHFEVRIGTPAPRVASGTVIDPQKVLPSPPENLPPDSRPESN